MLELQWKRRLGARSINLSYIDDEKSLAIKPRLHNERNLVLNVRGNIFTVAQKF